MGVAIRGCGLWCGRGYTCCRLSMNEATPKGQSAGLKHTGGTQVEVSGILFGCYGDLQT